MTTTTTTNFRVQEIFQNAIGRDEVEILLAALANVTVHDKQRLDSLIDLFQEMDATLEEVNGDDDCRYFTIALEPNDESKAS